ncbi:MAG: hypothetical protein IPL86_03065 [Flavobacteriales bacterium]|nr:hypothetical protein [Flavobacteriales bacterium]
MKTYIPFLSSLLLLSACGTLRETASVTDDVYDIPDRQAMAAAAAEKQQAQATQAVDIPDDNEAYYDPAESQRANSAYRDYYDMAYNDPYYYNYGRFGFGSGISSFGPSYGMGLSYGWPTSFGSMSVGYGMGYGGSYGYDPYWNNSWMSGYGYNAYSPYGYNPYGYYGYGNYGPGYGGYGQGYGPYQGPMGGCYGCYEPVGYSNAVYGHRSSLSSSSSSTDGSPAYATRNMRNPASLITPSTPSRESLRTPDRTARPDRITAPTRDRNARPSTPARNWDTTPTAPSRSGNDAGGGRTNSPRPR